MNCFDSNYYSTGPPPSREKFEMFVDMMMTVEYKLMYMSSILKLSGILSCLCGRVVLYAVLYAVLCMFNCLHVVCFKIV